MVPGRLTRCPRNWNSAISTGSITTLATVNHLLSRAIREPNNWIFETLRANRPKRFVDYGCGGGALLARVAATGVEAVGFDLDSDGLEAASRASGCRVHSIADIGMHVASADVVHLGDVLEHVPDPAEVLGRACSLLRPGGLLLSEGPLEANLSVFNGVIAIVALAGGGNQLIRRPITFTRLLQGVSGNCFNGWLDAVRIRDV